MVPDYMAIPPSITSKLEKVDVTGDVMSVNQIPFGVTMGQRLKFTTVENLPNRGAGTLAKTIRNVIDI